MTLLRACRAQGQEVFVVQHKVDSTIMVQLDQLRGFHLCLYAVHHLAFGQEFLRLLRASRLCNDSQQHKIEIRKRSFIRHLRIYSKACFTTSGQAWTSKHHFTSLHTRTACIRAPTSMVPTQHVRTLRHRRTLVRNGQSTQRCAPDHPMRCTDENIANRSPHHNDRGRAAAKHRSVANAPAVPQPRATCLFSTCRLRHTNG
jgi:hypothetical protein